MTSPALGAETEPSSSRQNFPSQAHLLAIMTLVAGELSFTFVGGAQIEEVESSTEDFAITKRDSFHS